MLKSFVSIGALAIVEKGLKLVVLMMLSRMLTPEVFGIVAAATVVVYFFEMFANLGFSQCLIQFKNINTALIRTALSLNLMFSLLLSLLFVGCLPAIAKLMAIPQFMEFGYVLPLVLIARSVSGIAMALMQRQQRAVAVMMASIVAYALGILGVTLPLILSGETYWALIAGLVAESVVLMVFTVVLGQLYYLPSLDKLSVAAVFNKGLGYFSARTVNYFAMNVDYVLVSRYLGTASLGFYSRAFRIMEYPSYVYRVAVDRVLFPALSQRQDDSNYLSEGLQKGLEVTVLLTSVISGLVAANATFIVYVLLGSQWQQTAGILTVLALFGSFRIINMLFNTYTKSVGKVSVTTQQALIMLFLITVFASSGVPFGMTGVALGVGLGLLLHTCLYAVRVARLLGICWHALLSKTLMTLPVTAAVFIPGYLAWQLLSLNVVSTFLISLLSSFIVLALLLLLPSQRVWGTYGLVLREAAISKCKVGVERWIARTSH